MAKMIKFRLLIDEAKVATLDELRCHFTADIIGHFRSGLLAEWLRSRSMTCELAAVVALASDDDTIVLKELCQIFKIEVADDAITEAIADMTTAAIADMTINEARHFSACVFCRFSSLAARATKKQIEEADGRRNRGNPISKEGSYVYAACDGEGELLYIGETGESIKARFKSHGSGAHNKKGWYIDIEKVRYMELPYGEDYRKLLERALIFAGNPIHQDSS